MSKINFFLNICIKLTGIFIASSSLYCMWEGINVINLEFNPMILFVIGVWYITGIVKFKE